METTQHMTVELYVRSLTSWAGRPQQEAVINRLERLNATDGIDEFTVHVWGQQVPLSTTTDAGQSVLDRVAEFREWAADTGRSLDRAFRTRQVDSEFVDEQYETLVLPMVVLAEYQDDDLRYVAPCSENGEVCTVRDRLDQLTTSETEQSEADGPQLLLPESE